jgi:hypothetical protein
MRDGRDVMVSLYFHNARGVPDGDYPPLTRRQRRIFPGLRNKRNVRENLPRFIEAQMKHPISTQGVNWGTHVTRFLEMEPANYALMVYERLLENPVDELRKAVLRITGEELEQNRLAASVEKYSFVRQSGRQPGTEDRSSFLRKGQVGDWVNYFNREAAEVFDRHCGEQLIAAGYETDRSWIAATALADDEQRLPLARSA